MATTNDMRNVPEWARVSKAEYRELRNELRRTAEASNFDFIGAWNIMIETMETRHALVAKGRRKNELTLALAVADTQKVMMKERAQMEQEKLQQDTVEDTEEYVRELARADAERVKAQRLVS